MAADRRAERLAALVPRLVAAEVDALLVSSVPNIRYLTGFTGTAGLLVVRTGAAPVLVVDFRYATQAVAEVGEAAEVVVDRVSVWERLAQALARIRPGRLAYEAGHVTVADLPRIEAGAPGAVVPVQGMVEALREVKAPEEVAAIRAAAALATEALAEVLPTIHVGQSEREVAARLEAALRVRGSEWHPFQTIVASGPRSALPHARTSERVVGRGEWLLLDFGAIVDGYCADLTRTVVVGAPPDQRQQEAYEIVRRAQRRAREQVRAGMTGREADALARDVLAAEGWADAFGHSLGHGLGLEVHEAPRLAPTTDAPLPLGAVVTIEPGVYLPGWGGVRLEDDVWLGPDGAECLSDGRTDLLALP
ncbi:MAG: M24 family metallopeptidase [Gemmatimonadales bacterium]